VGREDGGWWINTIVAIKSRALHRNASESVVAERAWLNFSTKISSIRGEHCTVRAASAIRAGRSRAALKTRLLYAIPFLIIFDSEKGITIKSRAKLSFFALEKFISYVLCTVTIEIFLFQRRYYVEKNKDKRKKFFPPLFSTFENFMIHFTETLCLLRRIFWGKMWNFLCAPVALILSLNHIIFVVCLLFVWLYIFFVQCTEK